MLTLHSILIIAALIVAIMGAIGIVSRVNLVALALALFFLSLLTGCAQFQATANNLADTPVGSRVVATAADKVIGLGLNAGATWIETNGDAGNPYIHAVADAIRNNPDGIVDPANVQKIFKDYGDPANQHKFKTLAKDVWVLAKDAAIRFGKENAAELIAKGLQGGAMSQADPHKA